MPPAETSSVGPRDLMATPFVMWGVQSLCPCGQGGIEETALVNWYPQPLCPLPSGWNADSPLMTWCRVGAANERRVVPYRGSAACRSVSD
jgi:hypothetical protein